MGWRKRKKRVRKTRDRRRFWEFVGDVLEDAAGLVSRVFKIFD